MKRFYIFIFVLGLIVVIAAVILIYHYEFNLNNINQARLVINGQEFSVEIVDTPIKQAKGLSGRRNLAANQGMLFIFSEPGIYGFWMKDMEFPIDIIWIKDRKIIGFEKNVSPESYPAVFYSPSQADMVLEVVAGIVDKFKFMAGDKVEML